MRHNDTLRRLTVSHIHMVTEDFRQFFRNIAGQLPELRKVTLYGITDPEPCGPPGRDFTVVQEYPDNSLAKFEIENFLLSGGIPLQWHNHYTWAGRRVTVTQKEDHLQSGLPEVIPCSMNRSWIMLGTNSMIAFELMSMCSCGI